MEVAALVRHNCKFASQQSSQLIQYESEKSNGQTISIGLSTIEGKFKADANELKQNSESKSEC